MVSRSNMESFLLLMLHSVYSRMLWNSHPAHRKVPLVQPLSPPEIGSLWSPKVRPHTALPLNSGGSNIITGQVGKHLTAYQEKWKFTVSFISAFDSLTQISLQPSASPGTLEYILLHHSGLLTAIKRITTFSLLTRGSKRPEKQPFMSSGDTKLSHPELS